MKLCFTNLSSSYLTFGAEGRNILISQTAANLRTLYFPYLLKKNIIFETLVFLSLA